jgi:hypothetical protein
MKFNRPDYVFGHVPRHHTPKVPPSRRRVPGTIRSIRMWCRCCYGLKQPAAAPRNWSIGKG